MDIQRWRNDISTINQLSCSDTSMTIPQWFSENYRQYNDSSPGI